MLTLAVTCALLPPALADEPAEVGELLRAGRVAEARAKVDQFLAAKPRDPQMRFLRGVIQTDTGQLDEAVQTFTQLVQDYPELPEPYNNLAVLQAGQGQLEKARAALEMAIRLNPGYATAYENLGDVHARLASQFYRRAQELDPANASVRPKLTLVRQLLASGKPATKE